MIIRKAHRRTWLLCRTPMGLIFLCPRIQGYYCSLRNPLCYIFAAKNPDACVGDEIRINKVKRIFFFTAPKKKGFFFRVRILPSKNMVSCVKDQ